MENQTETEADKPQPDASSESSGDCCEASLERVREWTRRTEDYVKKEPAKAVGAAVGVGMLLAIFPVFSVLGGLARVVFSLLRPLLLVLGGIKLYEEYEKRQRAGFERDQIPGESGKNPDQTAG